MPAVADDWAKAEGLDSGNVMARVTSQVAHGGRVFADDDDGGILRFWDSIRDSWQGWSFSQERLRETEKTKITGDQELSFGNFRRVHPKLPRLQKATMIVVNWVRSAGGMLVHWWRLKQEKKWIVVEAYLRPIFDSQIFVCWVDYWGCHQGDNVLHLFGPKTVWRQLQFGDYLWQLKKT